MKYEHIDKPNELKFNDKVMFFIIGMGLVLLALGGLNSFFAVL